jgi:RNA polymerase sigma factor (sigma-70 family)
MARRQLEQFIGTVRRGILARDGAGMTDGELLGVFVQHGDAAAFEALLRRHGSMVWSVCCRVLHDPHEAEDAFQATFLVLLRKADCIRLPDRLGGWLHGVAHRTALEARALIARRRQQERSLDALPHPEVRAESPWREWLPLLDGEVRRLPDKYRLPLVLCELEGRSRKEVAGQLGIPEGTLSSRLAYARKRLADRLSRRGVALSTGVLGLLLSCEAMAQVPVSLLLSTAKATKAFATGQNTGVSAAVAVLTQGVLKTMTMFHLKAVLVTLTVLVGLGVGGVAYYSPAAAPAAADPQKELEALRHENELLKLNLEVVLEKVRSQATEIRSLKAQQPVVKEGLEPSRDILVPTLVTSSWNVDLPADLDQAIKALREAPDRESRRRKAEALEKMMRKYRDQLK